MRYPPKAKPGDRVAVLSPSAGLPALFPDVYELGLRRLRDELGVTPVEYPTTRQLGAPAAARAADVNAAFADPDIAAVMATIGGDDQIIVLRHLDADVIRANPKPFFGYSDNTNLLAYLWNLGIVGYHGGSVMVHLGRSGHTHPTTIASLRAALFDDGWFPLTPPPDWGDEPVSWQTPERFDEAPPMWPHDGWDWVGWDRVDSPGLIEAPTWGGNIEIISWLLQAGLVAANDAYTGCVLYLETSEEMPAAEEVYRTLRNMGERGLLERFRALVVARPKAWERDRPNPPEAKRAYITAQRAAVERAVDEYCPGWPMVFGVDFGHTDPQLIIPNGGDIRLDGANRTIEVRY